MSLSLLRRPPNSQGDCEPKREFSNEISFSQGFDLVSKHSPVNAPEFPPGSHDGRPPSRSQSVHPHRRHSVVRETVVIGSAALGMQMLAEKRTSPETRSRAATVGSAPARLYHRYDEGPGAPDAGRVRSMTMV